MNKQAVNKAEKQLGGDVDTVLAPLAGIPTTEICLHTLACFPDTPRSSLKDIVCNDCLESSIIHQEDMEDLSHLQKKTQGEGNVDVAATGKGNGHLLRD